MSILSLPVQEAQKTIFRNFRETVQRHSPDQALDLFCQVFIDDNDHNSASDLTMTLYTIVMGKEQAVFEQTLTGVCEILVNAWRQQQETDAIAALGQRLIERTTSASTSSSSVFAKRLQQWLDDFSNSEAFDDLRATLTVESGWQQQYGDYLLIEQCWDESSPAEQRESAKALVKQLRGQFQLELAKYVSLGQRQVAGASNVTNPTALGKSVIPLIKRILLRRDHYRHEHLADRFRQQVPQMRFQQFKRNLRKYLMFAMTHPVKDKSFRSQLADILAPLDSSQHAMMTTSKQVTLVCESLIDGLTTFNGEKPTDLFAQSTAGDDPQALVTLLLKLVLVCPSVQVHLERKIAALMRAYACMAPEDCQTFIHFLEVFRVTFAVYSGDYEYTLVKINGAEPANEKGVNLKDYRIFAQNRVASAAG